MNCESVNKLIPLYFYGELSPEEEDRLEQHLDGCAGAAAKWSCSGPWLRRSTGAKCIRPRRCWPSAVTI